MARIIDEQKTRSKILQHARAVGCEKEIKIIFHKVDTMLKACKNEQERAEIAKYGAIEIFCMLDSYGALEVNGEVAIDRK